MKKILAVTLGLSLASFAALPAMAQEMIDEPVGNSMSNSPEQTYDGVDRDMATGSIDTFGGCQPGGVDGQSMADENACRSSKSSDNFNDHPNRNTANDRSGNQGSGGNNN